jgi:uncharacterized protein (TIGR02001 family)
MLLALLGLPICTPLAVASEFSGAATLTTEYIYRGLKMSGGDPAIQLGIDFEHDSGLFVGAWATTVELPSAQGYRHVEADYYAGFQYSSPKPWSAIVTVLRYTYPDQSGGRSYDYDEVLVGASWQERYSIELGYTDDLYGLGRIGRHWELKAEWPVDGAWVVVAALGGHDTSDAAIASYLHWDIGASARFSRLTVDLRWYDNEPIYGFLARQSAGSQLVVSVSTAF